MAGTNHAPPDGGGGGVVERRKRGPVDSVAQHSVAQRCKYGFSFNPDASSSLSLSSSLEGSAASQFLGGIAQKSLTFANASAVSASCDTMPFNALVSSTAAFITRVSGMSCGFVIY